MMLNTDLHGGMVDKKMTYNQFETNLRNTTAPIGTSLEVWAKRTYRFILKPLTLTVIYHFLQIKGS